uniref:Uncharacterized protein n=2 Tax=Amphimedon queenslandica TaxID=400682 RepID=A0A1X7TQD5_AMPQE
MVNVPDPPVGTEGVVLLRETSLAPPLRYLRRKGLETLMVKMCAKKSTWLALHHVTEETRSVKTAEKDALQLKKDKDKASWTSLADLRAVALYRAP